MDRHRGHYADSWAHLRRMNDHELKRLVYSGRERDSWLSMSSTELDTPLGRLYESPEGRPFSAGLAPFHEWTDHLVDAASDNALAPIKVALASLTVGDRTVDAGSVKQWNAYRKVDALNRPHGYNIHIKIVQDKIYRDRYHPSYASFDGIFNIIDGVIIVRNVIDPHVPEHRRGDASKPAERLPEWWKLHHILMASWMKLHVLVHAGGFNHPHFTGYRILEDTTKNDVRLIQKTELGKALGTAGLRQMIPWLNWIVINHRQDGETLQLIGRCLESRGHRDGYVPCYDQRETFARGHWGFYALLGTELGRSVVNFLAIHKDNRKVHSGMLLGIKVVSSVTIFQPENSHELSEEERYFYATHPVLIFKIDDCTTASKRDELEGARLHTEGKWMHLYHDMPCPRI